ncbi:hypothetical protein EVAR_4378_1 [Eumeta japonica]|uniref:Uncharacterized protein n=1 Tax=Eumeta variegata TaxID=151549 RepID=A0A4C1SXE8_EUMVA|nr:hypothetical protein EVAR_4378_1 [Eumeta japonica]
MTSQLAQTLTGHGRVAQYLLRFKLKDSPYCACDHTKIQDVLHLLKECDIFLREHAALKVELDVRVAMRHFLKIMENAEDRRKFYCGNGGY